MALFVDTSALFALLDEDDLFHNRAVTSWREFGARREQAFTTSYVLLESAVLLGRRFGPAAVRRLQYELAPLLDVHWVDQELHQRAVAAYLGAPRRLSLVDCSSFEAMRDLGLDTCFTFDSDFARQGFQCIP